MCSFLVFPCRFGSAICYLNSWLVRRCEHTRVEPNPVCCLLPLVVLQLSLLQTRVECLCFTPPVRSFVPSARLGSLRACVLYFYVLWSSPAPTVGGGGVVLVRDSVRFRQRPDPALQGNRAIRYRWPLFPGLLWLKSLLTTNSR